ncbi:MAG: hypothetical protein IPM58_06130 [Nitrospira sp.]|nr:hypothetical protein [Nitrospira sp.]
MHGRFLRRWQNANDRILWVLTKMFLKTCAPHYDTDMPVTAAIIRHYDGKERSYVALGLRSG